MTLQIVCQNCGAKYKLPATFAADKAKCKACGSVIDVAAQRDAGPDGDADAPAAATPAAARPAKARPAKDRADDAPAPRRAASGSRRDAGEGRATSGRSGGRRGRTAETGDDEGRPRRGRAAEKKTDKKTEKKQGNPALLWGGIGLVAVIIVALAFVFAERGEHARATDDTASSGAASSGDAAVKPAAADPANSAAAPADAASASGAAAEGTAKAGDATKPEAAAGEPAATEPQSEPRAEPKAEPKPRAAGEEFTDPSQVFDPKTATQPVSWPAAVSAEERAQAEAYVATIVEEGTGFRVDKAKTQLRETPYAAVFAITEALRNFDYFDADQSRTAYSLQELLRSIHDDKTNVNYRVPLAGVPRDEMVLKDVNYNAKRVNPWLQLIRQQYQTREGFQEYLAKLKTQKQN